MPEIERIVALQIALLAERLGAHTMHARTHRARAGVSGQAKHGVPGSGARNVARSIARYVTTPLSSAILRGEIASGQTARVAFDGKEITVNAA